MISNYWHRKPLDLAAFYSSWFTWSSRLADRWCRPCYKKDKWQGMEFVTSDINLDLFCSNQESNPAQQNMLFNTRSWLVAAPDLSWQPIKKKKKEEKRGGIRSYICDSISELRRKPRIEGPWDSMTFTSTAVAPLAQRWSFCKTYYVCHKCYRNVEENIICLCFQFNSL